MKIEKLTESILGWHLVITAFAFFGWGLFTLMALFISGSTPFLKILWVLIPFGPILFSVSIYFYKRKNYKVSLFLSLIVVGPAAAGLIFIFFLAMTHTQLHLG